MEIGAIVCDWLTAGHAWIVRASKKYVQLSGDPTKASLACLAARSCPHLNEISVLLLSFVGVPSGFKQIEPSLYSSSRLRPLNLGVVDAWPRDLTVPSSKWATTAVAAESDVEPLEWSGNWTGSSSGAQKLSVKFAG